MEQFGLEQLSDECIEFTFCGDFINWVVFLYDDNSISNPRVLDVLSPLTVPGHGR